MFGVFGSTSSAISRLKGVVPEGEWLPDDGRLDGNSKFPRTDVVCTLALELGFHPSYNCEINSRAGVLCSDMRTYDGPQPEVLSHSPHPPYENRDGFVIECIHGEEVSTITVGDWLPSSLPRVLEITKEEIDGLYLNIPDVYEYAISN